MDTIRWFDSLRGEGMIRLANGESIFVHFTDLIDRNIVDSNYSYPNELCKHILDTHFEAGMKVKWFDGVGWRQPEYAIGDPRDQH